MMSTLKSEIEAATRNLRVALKSDEVPMRGLAEALKAYAKEPPEDPYDMANRGEAIAQAMLALRHLEDARMRLGKVMQYALQGGVSKYEKE